MSGPGGDRRAQHLMLAAVVLLGLGVRLVPWRMTFTPEGVRFRGDTDPYYHALRAQRTVIQWPRVPWTDPNMNFPHGAQIPWPPLFDYAIAALSKTVWGSAATPERVAQVAALLPLAIGIALLPLVALLGQRLFGGGLWLDAALLVALWPANLRFGSVGAADQHGAELLLSSAILLAFVSSWRNADGSRLRRAVGPAILGVLVAAAFWTWQASSLYLLLLVAVTALWYTVAPAGDVTVRAMTRTLFRGCFLGAALLALSILLFGPPAALRRGGLNGLTGLPVAACAMASVFGGLLLVATRRDAVTTRPRRLLAVVGAAVLSLLPVATLAPLRIGIAHGLTALGRGNPWYEGISEYRPILFSGGEPLSTDIRNALSGFGLGLLVMPLALPPMWKRWKQRENDRPALFFLVVWGSAFLALTLREMRFELYLVVPMALWVCFALRSLADAVGRRFPLRRRIVAACVTAGGVLLVAIPALPSALTGEYARLPQGLETDLFPSLRWLRGQPSADASRPAVMAEWQLGHAIQYFAGKPVVATPFGTDLSETRGSAGDLGGLEDCAAFLFASAPDRAEAVLARRRIGFLLLGNPSVAAVRSFGFAPPGTPRPAGGSSDWISGTTVELYPPFFDLIPARLYFFDGMASNGALPSLGGYRLLHESSATDAIPGLPRAALYKVFGVVPGARIRIQGGSPGALLTARARIETNQGRVFEWTTGCRLDQEGGGALHLPYATGANGLVRAAPYRLSDGLHRGTLELDERDVAGEAMDVDLGR